ncbi:MAG: hypothetical protein JW940_38950, partial [Polyangiaceae bacterium]|nr:hypothetical protein [Polyangiaceae bacterium]
YPKLTEWLLDESSVVGPPFYNRWMGPIGLLVFALMGLAPLFGWRKTSGTSLRKAAAAPLAGAVLAGVLHGLFGARLGYPPIVASEEPYPGVLGRTLEALQSVLPWITVVLVAVNLVVVVQEFVFGILARRSAAARRDERESAAVSLVRLVDKNRRRYGGYIVHLGIVAMYLGFLGTAWTLNGETSLAPGAKYDLGKYSITYRQSYTCPGSPACTRAQQGDITKQMLFAQLLVHKAGRSLGTVTPAKFAYQRMPDSPTTEIGLLRGWDEDLYVALGSVDASSGRATFQVHINPLVTWIWVGLFVVIAGASISLWPEATATRLGAWAVARVAGAATASAALALWLGASSTSSGSPTSTMAASRAPASGSPGELRAGQPAHGLVLAPLAGLLLGGIGARRFSQARRWNRND